ncbi:hypothetical protein TYRP_022237 [Tyrophagus putrescentiae]|nr:hypothetical protein TYRP_022237 [Tyrophagus putrescentiae]
MLYLENDGHGDDDGGGFITRQSAPQNAHSHQSQQLEKSASQTTSQTTNQPTSQPANLNLKPPNRTVLTTFQPLRTPQNAEFAPFLPIFAESRFRIERVCGDGGDCGDKGDDSGGGGGGGGGDNNISTTSFNRQTPI